MYTRTPEDTHTHKGSFYLVSPLCIYSKKGVSASFGSNKNLTKNSEQFSTAYVPTCYSIQRFPATTQYMLPHVAVTLTRDGNV